MSKLDYGYDAEGWVCLRRRVFRYDLGIDSEVYLDLGDMHRQAQATASELCAGGFPPQEAARLAWSVVEEVALGYLDRATGAVQNCEEWTSAEEFRKGRGG